MSIIALEPTQLVRAPCLKVARLSAHRWADAESAMDPVFRRAARLLVIDAENSVLLFQYEDNQRKWWATPGGGLERDETFEQAAVREAVEELALTPPTTLMPLWCRTIEFSFRGQSIRQLEHYFFLGLSRHEVAFGVTVREARRLEGIVAARWWSLNEIETSSEEVFPEDLCERIRALLA